MVEMAKKEKESAEAARHAAADEAEQIIAEYKTAHEKLREQEMAGLQLEREKVKAESARIQAELEAARVASEESGARTQGCRGRSRKSARVKRDY